MKILVTGSAGFIGSRLVKKLKNSRIDVVEYDYVNSVLETLDNKSLLSKKVSDVDLIYHLAGISDPHDPTLNKINVEGTKTVAKIAKKNNTKIVFASTFGVYKVPKKGETITEEFDLDPRNDYGISKLAAEKQLNSHDILFRVSNVYGPGIPQGKHSVVSNFIYSIVNGQPVTINDKNASRDFIFVDDVVDGFFLILKNMEKSGVYNLCTGVETKVVDLIPKIEKITNHKAKVRYIDGNFTGNWKGDSNKVFTQMQWTPHISLDEGLMLTANNFLEK